MKKETIYNNYGIQYKAGKILSPSGEWIAPLLKKGNSKVGKAVFTYSQLPTNDLFDTKYGVVSVEHTLQANGEIKTDITAPKEIEIV